MNAIRSETGSTTILKKKTHKDQELAKTLKAKEKLLELAKTLKAKEKLVELAKTLKAKEKLVELAKTLKEKEKFLELVKDKDGQLQRIDRNGSLFFQNLRRKTDVLRRKWLSI